MKVGAPFLGQGGGPGLKSGLGACGHEPPDPAGDHGPLKWTGTMRSKGRGASGGLVARRAEEAALLAGFPVEPIERDATVGGTRQRRSGRSEREGQRPERGADGG